MTENRALPSNRWRRAPAVVLAGLAILLTPAAVLLTWTERVALNTSAYTRAVAPLAHDRAVQQAMTTELTEVVLARLPAGAPANPTLRAIVTAPISRFFSSNAFATVWTELNHRAHAQLIATASNRSATLRISGDTLQLDLTPVLASIEQRLDAVGVHLPAATSGPTIAVSRSPVLSQVRPWYVGLRIGAWAVWPGVLMLGAASIALSPAHRRRPRAAGLAAAAAGAAIVGAVALRLVVVPHSDSTAAAVLQRKIVDAVLHPLWVYVAIAAVACLSAAAVGRFWPWSRLVT